MKLRDLIKGTPAFKPLEELAKAAHEPQGTVTIVLENPDGHFDLCGAPTGKGTPCKLAASKCPFPSHNARRQA